MQNSSAPATGGNSAPSRCCCHGRCDCGCILCSIFIICIILLVAYFSVPGIVLKLPKFQVNSLSLTNFAYTQSMTGTWEIGFLIHNPNEKFDLNYDTLRTNLYYKNVSLSESQSASFSQDSKSDITLKAIISAVDVNVAQCYSLLINKEIMEHGSVEFNVEIVGSIKSGTLKPLLKDKNIIKRDFFAVCSGIPVSILSNGTSGELVGGIDCLTHND